LRTGNLAGGVVVLASHKNYRLSLKVFILSPMCVSVMNSLLAEYRRGIENKKHGEI